MVSRSLWACGFVGLALFPLGLRGQTPAVRAGAKEVEGVLRAYTAAFDSHNAAAMAELFENDAHTTLIEDGELLRGWRAIRAHIDSVADNQRLYGIRVRVGAIDVTALGGEYALGVVKYVEVLAPGSQYSRVMTVVFRHTSGRWRGINVHVSTQLPRE